MIERDTDAVTATARWLGPRERPLLGWLSAPANPAARRGGAPATTGVLILPPVGYPYWSSHRTLRVLAERLAAAGHFALRIDYDGTGDSAGEQWDGGRIAAWRASVAAGARELRELGCARLVLAGARLGATFALLDGAALEADGVVAWSPVRSGRRYAREIRLLATDVPAGAAPPDRDAPPFPEGTLVAAGCVYRPDTLADLASLSLEDLEAAPAPRALLLDATVASNQAPLAMRLRALDCEVQERAFPDAAQALQAPSEYATVPDDLLTAILQWIGPSDPADVPGVPEQSPESNPQATLTLPNASHLREEIVTLGPHRLTGILTQLSAASQAGATQQLQDDGGGPAAVVLFLNTGSEPHIGPGRAWVEYARALAARGHRCIRLDFRGWGESPDDGFAPGRPYDAHTIEDTASAITALREQGHERIVLVGLCASAWVALRTVLREPPDAVVALNPQLYWQPGDPVEATMAETHRRRTSEREREARGGRCGLWSALDLLGHRPWAARWLDDLAASDVPITLAFAAGDDGIVYLRNRLARRLAHACAGAIDVVEIPGIDHSMGRVWLRAHVVELIHECASRLACADPGRPV